MAVSAVFAKSVIEAYRCGLVLGDLGRHFPGGSDGSRGL